MAAPNDFFTWQSLATFAGTTTAATAVVNGICRVFPGFRHVAALGLAVSIGLCLAVSTMDATTGDIVLARPFATYLIAVLNGFFVFASAAGISAGGAHLTAAPGTPVAAGRARGGAAAPAGPTRAPAPAPAAPRFWRRWF